MNEQIAQQADHIASRLQALGKSNLRRLFIDMDEPVAELLKYCCSEHQRRQGGNLVDYTQIAEWGFGAANFSYLFDESGTFRNLTHVPFARDTLMVMCAQGFDIRFATSPWSLQSLSEKMQWIDEHFPFLGWRRVIPITDKHLLRGDLLLDDGPHNLEAVPDDMISVAWDRPYNQRVSKQPDARVSSWLEFYQLVNTVNIKMREVQLS